MNELITTEPEYEQLKREIEVLRRQVTKLTQERDELRYHICPEIQAEYDKKVGILENQIFAMMVKCAMLRRQIEYVQAAMNREEEPDYKEAEKKVEEEFQQYEEDMHDRAERINNAKEHSKKAEEQQKKWEEEQAERKKEREEKEDTKEEDTKGDNSDTPESTVDDEEYKSFQDELKKRYRKIVKALHPDMNPNQTEEEKQMFREAVEAYKEGDLDKLREISSIIDGNEDEEDKSDNKTQDIEKLRRIYEELKRTVEVVSQEIEAIKNSFPYTAKEFLQDEEAVEERRQELEKELSEYNDAYDELELRLKNMREGVAS